MSFRIFASGTGNFGYSKHGIDFGDVYDLGAGLDRMRSAGGGARSFVQDEVTGAATPDSPLQQTLNAAGQINGFHLLENSVTFMLLEMDLIHVHLSARQSNWWTPDTARGRSLILSSRYHNPVREFLRGINPVLDATEMRTFGVLAALAAVFSRYSTEDRQVDGSALLLIQLSH